MIRSAEQEIQRDAEEIGQKQSVIRRNGRAFFDPADRAFAHAGTQSQIVHRHFSLFSKFPHPFAEGGGQIFRPVQTITPFHTLFFAEGL